MNFHNLEQERNYLLRFLGILLRNLLLLDRSGELPKHDQLHS